MAQSQDNCAKPGLLAVSDAEKQIQAAIQPILDTQLLALKQCLNRVLAEDISAGFDVPRERNSSMDGYAIASSDLKNNNRQFRVIGTSWAGKPFKGVVKSGECVRIFTGAVLPDNTDTVIIQEQVTRSAESIYFQNETKHGEHVRHPGEDIKQGAVILRKGTQLSPAEIGLLASLGIVSVQVYRLIRVAFFSTGDELRRLTEPLESGQLYDSNRYSLNALLEQSGVIPVDLGVVPDNLNQLRETLNIACDSSDLIISTGGASVGDADLIQPLLQETGNIKFWKLAIKPGKPLVFGSIQQTPFFGLPGNPVSVMVTFLILVRPAIFKRMAKTATQSLKIEVPTSRNIHRKPGRQEYLRGVLGFVNNQLQVTPLTAQGSHIMYSMVRANCFIVIPAENTFIGKDKMVTVIPFQTDIWS